jgi:hypothetical protein
MGERVTFFACAKKGNQRNKPPAARSSGILPCDFARVLRGSLDARPCTFSERPRIVRGLLRTDPAHPRRASGGPVRAASCRRSKARAKPKPSQCFPLPHLRVVQGCTDSWINGAVRGAEHRSPRRKMPEGARRWIAAIAKQYTDVLSEQPGAGEKRRGFCRARSAAKHCVRCLAFLVTFWAMPKSNRLAAGETKLCTWTKTDSRLPGNDVESRELDSGLRRNDELEKKRESQGRPIPTQRCPTRPSRPRQATRRCASCSARSAAREPMARKRAASPP